MTTRYAPQERPPADRWGFRILATGADPDGGNAYIEASVLADTRERAEQRALAVLDYDFEDDLRGARADAEFTGRDDWVVVVRLARPRWWVSSTRVIVRPEWVTASCTTCWAWWL